MADLKTQLSLVDRVSATLQRVQKAYSQTSKQARMLDRAAKANERAMRHSAAGSKFTARALDTVKRKAQEARQAFHKLAEEAQKTDSSLKRTGSGLRNVFLGASALGATKSLADQSDAYASMHARLDMINDGQRTTTQLQDEIFQSAQRTGSVYNEMANGLAKMRMNASNVFKNNGETLKFLETMNKSFIVGGAGAEDQKSAMLQLTQAMASGRLQGDELRSLSETSPMLIQAIADKLKITRGEVKQLGAEGRITADIVKSAMLDASDRIEEQFNKMPLTFGRAWTRVTNYLTKQLEPVSERLSKAVNSQEFAEFTNVLTHGIGIAIRALDVFLNVMANAWSVTKATVSWAKDNWSWLGPIIYTVVGALTVYTLSAKLAQFQTKLLIGSAKAFVAVIKLLNTANPFTKIAMGIGLVISLIYILVGMWNYFTGQSVSATGLIVGALYWLGSVLWDIVAFIYNTGAGIVEFLTNIPKAFYELFYNLLQYFGSGLVKMLVGIDNFVNSSVAAFYDMEFEAQTAWFNIVQGAGSMAVAVGQAVDGMVNSVISSVESMLNSVLSGINKLIGMLNKIPGVSISAVGQVSLRRSNLGGAISGYVNSMQAPTRKSFQRSNMGGAVKNWLQSFEKTRKSDYKEFKRLDYLSPSKAFAEGYAKGEEFVQSFNNFFKGAGALGDGTGGQGYVPHDPVGSLPGTPGGEKQLGQGSGGSGGGNPTGGKLDSVGRIEDEVSIGDEFIKLVKDVAEMKFQQNFITLRPEVVTNIGTINDMAEYGNALDQLNATIVEAIENGADGI